MYLLTNIMDRNTFSKYFKVRLNLLKVCLIVIDFKLNIGGNIMRTTIALVVKFILTFVMAFIAFDLLLDNDVSWILLLALAGTAINYLIGDLAVLPSMGNFVASIGDGLLAAVTAYIFDILIAGFSTTWTTLLWFGILVAIGEYFFHLYLKKDEKVAP